VSILRETAIIAGILIAALIVALGIGFLMGKV